MSDTPLGNDAVPPPGNHPAGRDLAPPAGPSGLIPMGPPAASGPMLAVADGVIDAASALDYSKRVIGNSVGQLVRQADAQLDDAVAPYIDAVGGGIEAAVQLMDDAHARLAAYVAGQVTAAGQTLTSAIGVVGPPPGTLTGSRPAVTMSRAESLALPSPTAGPAPQPSVSFSGTTAVPPPFSPVVDWSPDARIQAPLVDAGAGSPPVPCVSTQGAVYSAFGAEMYRRFPVLATGLPGFTYRAAVWPIFRDVLHVTPYFYSQLFDPSMGFSFLDEIPDPGTPQWVSRIGEFFCGMPGSAAWTDYRDSFCNCATTGGGGSGPPVTPPTPPPAAPPVSTCAPVCPPEICQTWNVPAWAQSSCYPPWESAWLAYLPERVRPTIQAATAAQLTADVAGWIIGPFDPSQVPTEDVEPGVSSHGVAGRSISSQ